MRRRDRRTMPFLKSPAARGVRQLVRLLPRISRPRTALLACTTIATALLPLGATVAIGLLVGTVPEAAEAGPGSPEAEAAYGLLGAAALAMLLQRLVDHLHRAN